MKNVFLVFCELPQIKCYPGGVLEERKKISLPHGKMLPENEGMKMKLKTREEQLEVWRERYGQRGLEGKAQMLDALCQEYGYHRKHAIRLLNGQVQIKESPPGPEPRYGALKEMVEQIWGAGEQPCGKRLAQMLPLWLPHYQRRYGRLLPQ